MFTNIYGERVVRVINHRLQVVDKLELVHQGADYLAVANILAKLAVNNLIKGDAVKVAEEYLASIVEMLAHYKNERGEIKFAELQVHPHMKSCLAYLHSVSACCLFTNLTKANADRKVDEIIKINSLGFRDFANKYYPKLYCVDLGIYGDEPFPGDYLESEPDVAILPPSLPLTHSSIKQDSAYLVQDNDFIYLFVTGNASEELLNELFGVSTLEEVNIDTGLPELETGHSIRVANIVAEIRRRNTGLYLPLLVLTPMIKGMYDERLYSLLKEDNKERTYLFFLKHLHSRVQNGK